MDHTSLNQIIVDIMMAFMVLGAVDFCLGNRFGLGAQFERGIQTMGPLALSMVGIVSLAPVLGEVLSPVVGPIYSALGADPAMFATTLLACDMGGYSLAQSMARTPEAADFAGILLGCTMGCTLVFTVPVALGIIDRADRIHLARGVLCGLVCLPMGCLAGGAAAGYSFSMMMRNLTPILLAAALVGAGLWLRPSAMIKEFDVFGKGVIALGVLSLMLVILEQLAGITLIPGMAPASEGILTVGSIAMMLAGAYPLVSVLTRLFQKPLSALGKVLRVNGSAVAGLLASLASSLPMFAMMKDMDERGKVMNAAFAVCGAYALGGHLGFTAGAARHMIVPMLIGKLVGGLLAVILAGWMTKKCQKEGTPAKSPWSNRKIQKEGDL